MKDEAALRLNACIQETVQTPDLRRLTAQLVIRFGDVARPALIGDDGGGPQHRILARLLILIPTAASARLPDRSLQFLGHLRDEALLNSRLEFHDRLLAPTHQFQTVHRVTNLRLNHQDDGVVSQSRIRPQKNEEIRKAAEPRIRGDAG